MHDACMRHVNDHFICLQAWLVFMQLLLKSIHVLQYFKFVIHHTYCEMENVITVFDEILCWMSEECNISMSMTYLIFVIQFSFNCS